MQPWSRQAYPYHIQIDHPEYPIEVSKRSDYPYNTTLHVFSHFVGKLYYSKAEKFLSFWKKSFSQNSLQDQTTLICQDFIIKQCIKNNGALIHAAAVSIAETSYIFPGLSNTGKSTFADLARKCSEIEYVGDEFILIYRDQNRYRFTSIEHWFPNRNNQKCVDGKTGEIKYCIFLQKGRGDIKKMDRASGREQFQKIAAADFFAPLDSESLSKNRSNIIDITRTLNFYSMPFLLDSSPFQLLNTIL